MKKLTYAVLLLFIMGASLLAGIYIQKNKIPSRILHKLSKFISIDEKKIQTYNMPVSQELIKIFGEPMDIYVQEDQYIYNTTEEKGPWDSSYRYYWHYEEIAEYLVSNEAKSSAFNIYKEFWSLGKESGDFFVKEIESKREFLKETLGVRNLDSHYKLKFSDVVFQDDNITIKLLILESRIHSISVPVYVAIPDKKIRGVVIAIHGHSGAPEKVIGLEPRDYTRKFGEKLAKEGYIVFAPYVLNISRLNTNVHALGMLYTGNTKYSIDLQKLLSIVDYIKNDPVMTHQPLTIYGVSYGGRLSFMLAAIDERIDAVVTSGGMKLNYEFLEEHYSLENNIYWASEVIFNRPFHIYFRFSDLAKMIYPRPLIVEIGAYDFGDHPDAIVYELDNIQAFYSLYGKEQNFRISWFKGYHETAPKLTIPILNSFIDNL